MLLPGAWGRWEGGGGEVGGGRGEGKIEFYVCEYTGQRSFTSTSPLLNVKCISGLFSN